MQDGDGPWQRVLPSGGGSTWSFSFSSDRGGIARVYPSGNDEYIDVSYASIDEWVSEFAYYDTGSDCSTRTVNLSVAGVPSGSYALTSVNGEHKDLVNGPEAYDFIGSGAVDIVAARADGGGNVDRIIVRKGVNVPASGTVTPDIDFDAGEGFAPEMMNVTITSLGAEDTDVWLEFSWLPGGKHASLLGRGTVGSGTTPTLAVPAVPASQASADDWHQLRSSVTTSGGNRIGNLMFQGVGDRSVALGPVLAQETISAGAHGPRVQLVMQPEYNQAIDARFSYEGSTIILTATARSLGNPSAWDLSMPDLTGVEGWQAGWTPPANAWENWLLIAFGGTWPWYGPPTNGGVYRTASRSSGPLITVPQQGASPSPCWTRLVHTRRNFPGTTSCAGAWVQSRRHSGSSP